MKMARRMSKPTEELYEDLAALETYLQSQLHPVSPSPEFLYTLRNQMMVGEVPVEQALRNSRKVFFAVAGLISSILLVIGGVRAIIKMIEAIQGMRAVEQKVAAP